MKMQRRSAIQTKSANRNNCGAVGMAWQQLGGFGLKQGGTAVNFGPFCRKNLQKGFLFYQEKWPVT